MHGDGGGRGLIMDQDKSMKITDHGKFKIRNHDKIFPFYVQSLVTTGLSITDHGI